MKITGYDFSGWATKNDLRCADNKVIRKDAFKVQDGAKVPLMWNHKHDTTSAVLGHAILENKDDGVFTYGFFNNTAAGKEAKEILQHGDVTALSIYANNLVQSGNDVLHGAIREVSLVLAGANPGAFVESVVCHGESLDEDESEGLLFTGEDIIIAHSGDAESAEESDDESEDEEDSKEDETVAKSAREIFDGMTEEQQGLVNDIVEAMMDDSEDTEEIEHSAIEEDDTMKRNVFDQGTENNQEVIAHSEILSGMLEDAKKHKVGSLKEVINDAIEDGTLQHSIDTTGMIVAQPGEWRQDIPEGRPTVYGFNDPEFLFPEPHNLNNPPEWIQRNQDWVSVLMSKVHRSPFSRIRSTFADITENEARAKGYTKTHQKVEEIFGLLKRITTPTTIYKKQRMDRDDIIDITDFDVVAWIKGEMRVMLNEEIARAVLIGDGRLATSPDKIDEGCIRPIAKDDPLFTIKCPVNVAHGATDDVKAKKAIDAVIRSRKNYKGSGNPILFTTEDWVTEMLLLEDGIGHKLYKTESELATTLRVSRIVTVELLENQTIGVEETSGGSTNIVQKPLLGIIVNPVDYRDVR